MVAAQYPHTECCAVQHAARRNYVGWGPRYRPATRAPEIKVDPPRSYQAGRSLVW